VAEQIRMSKRILVLGPSGSGKTFLAQRLAELLNVELIHLDAQFWKPGWVSTPQDQWREAVAALVRKPRWIIDGMYESTLDLRLPAADAVIVIERPRLACLLSVCARTLKHRGGRERVDAPPFQKLDRAFVKYIWRYPSVTRPIMLQRLRDYAQDKSVLFFRGRKDVRRFLALVGNP
jgi:adenylate kinase family enzyme